MKKSSIFLTLLHLHICATTLVYMYILQLHISLNIYQLFFLFSDNSYHVENAFHYL